MKTRDVEKSEVYPLVMLSNKLSRAAGQEKNEIGDPAPPMMFDSSISCAALHDHMFNGLIKNMLLILFHALGSIATHVPVEKRMSSSAREIGLPVTDHILKWGGKREFIGLKNQTMATFMCLLLCLAPTFDIVYKNTELRVFRLAKKVHNFAATVYFWPIARADGAPDSDMFTTGRRMKYYVDLHEMEREYLYDCD